MSGYAVAHLRDVTMNADIVGTSSASTPRWRRSTVDSQSTVAPSRYSKGPGPGTS